MQLSITQMKGAGKSSPYQPPPIKKRPCSALAAVFPEQPRFLIENITQADITLAFQFVATSQPGCREEFLGAFYERRRCSLGKSTTSTTDNRAAQDLHLRV